MPRSAFSPSSLDAEARVLLCKGSRSRRRAKYSTCSSYLVQNRPRLSTRASCCPEFEQELVDGGGESQAKPSSRFARWWCDSPLARRHLEVLRRNFGDRPNVRILSQPNAGKSAALNNAIARARHDLLIALDADTIFRAGTIGKLVRHFADSQVGAVSGNARVGNRNSWITRFQSIEYIYGFNLDRRALDLLNAITVVPGAVGAWRKELVLKLGGFGGDTLAEDTDLTLKIRRAGYQIRYEEGGVAFTEAPEDTRGLAKQRFRWAFGTLQAAWKHRDALFVPKYGTLG